MTNNNFFDGLEEIMKGVLHFDIQDDPGIKIMAAKAEVSELKKQEKEVFAEIGKKAVAMYGAEKFDELEGRLKLVQDNLTAAQEKLKEAQQGRREKAQQEEEEKICPSCGASNPKEMDFCQQCGEPLEKEDLGFCTNCGAVLKSGAHFCGKCGSKIGDE